MAEGRPAIPKDLERQVLMEAGHRCAIPTCRHPTTELAHIIPWAQVHEHEFENLIALCPNCHARYDKAEIDRKAMLQYKVNLSILNGRYGDLERRLLRHFANHPDHQKVWLPGGLDILVTFLLEDGFLAHAEKQPEIGTLSSARSMVLYELTESGQEFVKRWVGAQSLD